MKIVGLITEYNPFHNGHLYHIEESKKITGADAAVVVMSGDYVQRGTPAVMPKRLRTEMALKCGAAAVFELPVCYASGSAEYFALGAVSLLQKLGIVDSLCFGSECNDLDAGSAPRHPGSERKAPGDESGGTSDSSHGRAPAGSRFDRPASGRFQPAIHPDCEFL